jgi:diguanylate cyclase (GGDEF)-like protein/PAS domain S-box-containing protein
MQILSAGENYLLGRRFSGAVKLGLVLLGLTACAITAISIQGDRRASEQLARQSDRDMSAALKTLADNIMDQAYYSLVGMASDVPHAPNAADFMAQQASISLRNAMRFDPVTRFLFIKGAGKTVVINQIGQLTPGVDAALDQLQEPTVTEEPFLATPVQGPDASYLVPLQLATTMTRDGTRLTLGALIPLRKLAETQAGLGERPRSGQALYLRDGRVLMRSVNQDRFIGRQAPESAAVAALAQTQAADDFAATATTGQHLTGHYARSERYPFVASSGQLADTYLIPWQQRSYAKAAVLALFLGLLALAGRVLLRTLASLSTSSALYRRLFEDVADGVLVHTPAGEIRGLNDTALRLTGLKDPAGAIGRSMFDFFPRTIDPKTGQLSTLAADYAARALAGERLRYEYSFDAPLTRQHYDCDVHLSAFEINSEKLLLSVARDITDERRHVRQQEYLANHDPLTGLPNRYSLVRTLERHIDTAPDAPLDLVLVNLLRFKEINESFGHRAGDTMLEVAAQRLSKSLAEKKWALARLGGTDLVALSADAQAASADAICQLILKVAAEPIGIGDNAVELRAILGVTRYPDDALDASQLLRCAEVAATHAKLSGLQCASYSKEFDHRPGHDLKMRTDLSAAIRQGQLQLAYQPKVWLEDRGVAGVEALLRWNHPKLGWIPPSEFIPLAESTELIHPLTRWVVGEALEQILAWQQAGQPLKVAVNISTNNLQDPDFTDYVKNLLQRKGVRPELLELEVTEGALARNPEIMLRRLQDLRTAGISLSLDDFGTGFSSLSYVSQFPFTSIKIDRSFVAALLASPRDRQVAESTIDLGRKLGLQTIAEGVEDEATAAALLALECEVGQGYLFAKPMLLPEFQEWFAAHEAKLVDAQRQALASSRL